MLTKKNKMKTASLVFGITAVVLLVIGFFPCLGSLNWINLPIASIGLIISIIALVQTKEGEPKGNAILGIVLCGLAILLGLLRLIIGGGVI